MSRICRRSRCGSACCATSRRSTCRPSCSASAGRCRSGSARSAWPACMRGAARCRRRGPRRAAGVPFALSTLSACSIERSRAAAGAVLVPALHRSRTAASSRDMIARASEAGLRRAAADRRPAGARHAATATSAPACRRRPAALRARFCQVVAAAALGVGRRRPRPAAQPRQSRAGARRRTRRSRTISGWIARQFRRRRHLEGRRLGARAMARAR